MWPIGVPLVVFLMLHRNRSLIKANDPETTKVFSFLLDDYKAEHHIVDAGPEETEHKKKGHKKHGHKKGHKGKGKKGHKGKKGKGKGKGKAKGKGKRGKGKKKK